MTIREIQKKCSGYYDHTINTTKIKREITIRKTMGRRIIYVYHYHLPLITYSKFARTATSAKHRRRCSCRDPAVNPLSHPIFVQLPTAWRIYRNIRLRFGSIELAQPMANGRTRFAYTICSIVCFQPTMPWRQNRSRRCQACRSTNRFSFYPRPLSPPWHTIKTWKQLCNNL